MKPSEHIAASFALSTAFFYWTGSIAASVICFFSGFLLDADHVIEFLIHHGYKKYSLKKCYQACIETGKREGAYQFRKLYLVFHSMEFALLCFILAWKTHNLYLFAGITSYLLHLVMDYIGNPVRPGSYFLLWRIYVKFDTNRILRAKA